MLEPSPLLSQPTRPWPAPALPEPTGPRGLELYAVQGTDLPALERTEALFGQFFPQYLRYLPYIRACAQQHSPEHPGMLGHVWLVLDPAREGQREGRGPLDQAVGLQIFNYVFPGQAALGFGMGAFRGLEEPYQHGGVGSWLLRGAQQQIALDASARGEGPPRGHVVEVKLPPAAEARRAFALKTGAQVLELDYLEPPMLRGVSYHSPASLEGTLPQPMSLVFYPSGERGPLEPSEMRALLLGLYLDYYRLDPFDPLLAEALASLERGVEVLPPTPRSP